jgi:hypothetical protein
MAFPLSDIALPWTKIILYIPLHVLSNTHTSEIKQQVFPFTRFWLVMEKSLHVFVADTHLSDLIQARLLRILFRLLNQITLVSTSFVWILKWGKWILAEDHLFKKMIWMKLKHNYIYYFQTQDKPDCGTGQAHESSKWLQWTASISSHSDFISYIKILTIGKKCRIGKIENEDI